MMRIRLSEHFHLDEFACPCCDRVMVEPVPRLAAALEEMRVNLCQLAGRDVPIVINSGYRCKAHNAMVGGSVSSQHLSGLAADLRRIEGLALADVLEAALAVPEIAQGGVGLYVQGMGQGRLHVDIRRDGPPARWAYYHEHRQPWEQVVKSVRERRAILY